MQRLSVKPRPAWQAEVEACGLIWHSGDQQPYWNESACYRFSPKEIADIEAATAELYRLFLAAGDHVVEHGLFGRFDIPEWCWPLVTEAWHDSPPALNYGRFDLGFDGKDPPKLFEFNCDTPTSLLEAAVVQWQWKTAVFPRADQFNSLHEKLVAKWADLRQTLDTDLMHFAYIEDMAGEDAVTVAYLVDTARQAGWMTESLGLSEIGWADNAAGGGFYDLQDREIRALYKLYPWEWLVRESFGRHLSGNYGRTLWLEPIWKMIWSNKAILPVLWELFPDHPNLLWAGHDVPAFDHVRKPVLAREGSNVQIVCDGQVIAETDGDYGGASVFQALCDLPDFDGDRPVIGSWIIDGEPAGMGIREDGPITSNTARFVPHIID